MVHYVNRFPLGDDETLAGVLADYEAASAETDRGIGALDDPSRARRRVGQAMATSGLTGQLHVSGR